MKRKPRHSKRTLHEPIPELKAATAMPKEQRCNKRQRKAGGVSRPGSEHHYSTADLQTFYDRAHRASSSSM